MERSDDVKRMRDYSKWPLMRLLIQAAHHREVITRLSTRGFPCGANKLVLAEIERQIQAKRGASV
jgi:hypothetical protein